MRRIPFAPIILGALALAALSFAALMLIKVLLLVAVAAFAGRIASHKWHRYAGNLRHQPFAGMPDHARALQLGTRSREHVISID